MNLILLIFLTTIMFGWWISPEYARWGPSSGPLLVIVVFLLLLLLL